MNTHIIIAIIMRINIPFYIIIKGARYSIVIFFERLEIWIWIVLKFSLFKFIEILK